MNNDTNVLQFDEDVNMYELVDVYVEHIIDNSEVVEEFELGHAYD